MQFKKYVCLALVSLSVNSAVASQADLASKDVDSVEAELGQGKIDATVTETTMDLIKQIKEKIQIKENQDSTDSIELVVMAGKKVKALKKLVKKDGYAAFVAASALNEALDLINAIDLEEQFQVTENNLEKKAGMELLIKQLREVKLKSVIKKIGKVDQLNEVRDLTQEFFTSPYLAK